MTEFQAALLLAQLTRFEQQCQLRDRNARYLTSLLKEIPGCSAAAPHAGCTRNTHYIFMAHYDPDKSRGSPGPASCALCVAKASLAAPVTAP